MIVAAGTPQREAQERGAHRPDNVVELLVPVDQRVGRLIVPRPQAQEGRCHQGARCAIGHFVPRQLLGHKPIVREIGIERIDDPVPIPPGVRFGTIPLVAIRLGKAGDVQPATAPPHAVARVGEQPVNHAGSSKLRGIGFKFRNLVRRGGQSHQVQRHPSQPVASTRRGVESQPSGLQFGQQEAVDSRGSRLPLGKLGLGDGLKGPVLVVRFLKGNAINQRVGWPHWSRGGLVDRFGRPRSDGSRPSHHEQPSQPPRDPPTQSQ